MRQAAAYMRKGKIYIQGYAQSVTEVWIANGPVLVADLEDGPADIGSKVKLALSHSVLGLAHPAQDQWKAIQAPLLDAAGVKTWNTFAKGALAVGIEEAGGIVTFIPSSNYERDGGESMTNAALKASIDDQCLGDALTRAFSMCT